jgi:two-component system sensor histidine kinase HydH
MRLHSTLSPRVVIAVTSIVAALMIGTGYYELQQSREELAHVMHEEALSLAETINRGGSNAILSMERIEDLLASRLLDNARFVARLDSLGKLTPATLWSLAESNHLYRVNVFDRNGRRVMSSHVAISGHEGLNEKNTPREFLHPVLKGNVDQLIIGIKEARFEEGQRYAVAVRRTRPGGGAVVVNIDAGEFLEFRRSVGIGKLIRDLGDNSGIVYVALQDTEGILAASKEVSELSAVAYDPLVAEAADADTTLTRVADFQGEQVFEVIRRFSPGGDHLGVFRIALSMEEMRNTEARMTRRAIVMSLVLLVIAALAAIFVIMRQNVMVSERKYSVMTAYTGNILAQMREGVVTIDREDTILMFNRRAEELLGVTAEGFGGRSLNTLQQGHTATLARLFSREDGSTELLLKERDGSERILEVSISTTRNTTGEPESRTALLRDLTAARQLEREVRRKDKLTAMGELASGVAHEIRNPLNAMGLIAQRFGKEFTPRRGVREFRSLAEVMQSETRRVNGIIRQFLAFARPPALRKITTQLPEFFDRIAATFAAQSAEKGVAFTTSCDAELEAEIDPDQMTQAMLNVLQNALDATPRGGRINLTARAIGRKVRVTVKDTGKGISPTELEKIFNLYYTTKPDGSGLGLSITEQIVGQHDGRIDISSEPGKGTTFIIELPFS